MADEQTHVRLGEVREGGLSPAILAIVDRGIHRRPALMRHVRAEVELDFGELYPRVRIVFDERLVLVEDLPAVAPDLRIAGTLADLVSLMVAPLLRGVPSPVTPRGRAALGMVALRRVRIDGRLGLLRRFLRLIRV